MGTNNSTHSTHIAFSFTSSSTLCQCVSAYFAGVLPACTLQWILVSLPHTYPKITTQQRPPPPPPPPPPPHPPPHITTPTLLHTNTRAMGTLDSIASWDHAACLIPKHCVLRPFFVMNAELCEDPDSLDWFSIEIEIND